MNKILIYGILNVTPDSFSDGGRFLDTDAAVNHALSMIEDGADVIDIGGMSTRPGYEDVSDDEETERIIPVIRALKEKVPGCVISVDTFRAGTAKAALVAGADIINDISGLMGDPDMAGVIAEYKARAVLMRNGLGDPDEGWEVMLQRTVDAARNAGIKDSKIVLDPGVGFTKTRKQDMELINAIPDMIDKWGYPVLLGVSRKRISAEFYKGETKADERLGASLALALYGVEKGATELRVHDVKDTYAALKAVARLKGEEL